MLWTPCLLRSSGPDGEVRASLGDPLVDDYLRFVAARSRPNTVLATAYDLKVFFSVVGKEPARVSTADVMGFLAAQRAPRRGPRVVRLEDGESGLSARTLKRRLASLSGLFAYLLARDDVELRRNPVPCGLGTRHPRGSGARGVPLIRTPRTLPKVLSPIEVDKLLGALRTHRDRAMVLAMLLGGLRRCEMLGLRMVDVRAGERRLFIAEGKGGHQRIVPVSQRVFTSLADYFGQERPQTDTEHVFVVLRGPNRGRVLTAAGVDQVLSGARERAGLDHATCHQLRHTCLTRLREAGMALEAVQAQAGHRSIESTRVYLHLANAWLAEEYARAVNAIEGELTGQVQDGGR
jgi:site-specific recombinase XerD